MGSPGESLYQPSPGAARPSSAFRSSIIHAASPENSFHFLARSSLTAWLTAVNHAQLFRRTGCCVQLASHAWMFARSRDVSSGNSLSRSTHTDHATTDDSTCRWFDLFA